MDPIPISGHHGGSMGGGLVHLRGVIEVLEAAHEASPSCWANEVGQAMNRAGRGALEGTALLHYRGAEGALSPLHPLSGDLKTLIATGQASLSSDQNARVYARQATATFASEVFDGAVPERFADTLGGFGLSDFVGLTAPLGDGDSFSIGAGLTRTASLEPAPRSRLAGLALHLGTVWQARCGTGRDLLAEDMEPEPPADDAPARQAHHQLDRALARARRIRGEDTAAEAVQAWDALLREGWVVVRRQGEGDRRKVLLVRIPRQHGAEVFRLTETERQVIDRVASAASNKEIAYDMGIPEATVATTFLRARRKLGIRSRVELVQLKRWLRTEPTPPTEKKTPSEKPGVLEG